ncbi:hypothetical protein Tco_0434897, partial [Tanacetum coccineum]
MGDDNPIRTLGDYSKPSYEGYRNTIEHPAGNNMVPLRSDAIRLVQNGCSFHGLRFEDPNQQLKDFLKLMDSLDLDDENKERTRLRLFQFPLRDQASNWLEHLSNLYLKHGLVSRTYFKSPSSWHRPLALKDLALYDYESWNDPRDFAKPVKEIALPQGVPNSDTEEEDDSSTNACDLNLGGMVKGNEEVMEKGEEEDEMETDMKVEEVFEEEESEFETDEEIEEIFVEEEEDEDDKFFNSFPTMKELSHHKWLLKNPRPSWVKAK